LVDFWPDLVVFSLISVVFAEIYTRIKVRWALRRAARALQALAAGEDTTDARLVRHITTGLLGAVAGLLIARGDDDRWHLTKLARGMIGRGLQAIGELAPKGPAGGQAVGLNLAGLDLDQLVSFGISQLPKKQQGFAAMAYGIAKPFVGQLQAWFSRPKTEEGKMSENPFLKELKP